MTKQKQISQEPDLPNQLLLAAEALLKKIDDITTEQFSRGEEREEREALRKVIEAIKAQTSK